MRFVPHRNISFQYSLDDIDDDYDSGYSSDSSLETPSVSPLNDLKAILLNSSIETLSTGDEDFQLSTLSHILEDLEIQERFLLVCEASGLIEQETLPQTSKQQFESLISQWNDQQKKKLAITSAPDDRLRKFSDLKQADEKNLISNTDIQFEKHNLEINSIMHQIEEERRRKLEEELRRKAEEERKRREEEEERRKKLEEEERKRKQVEEEEKRRKQLEAEKKLKEAEALRKQKELDDAKKRKQEEELAKLKLEEEKRLLQLNLVGLHNDLRIEKEFFKYKQDIADIKLNVVEPLLANKELKQLTNKIRRKINPKFGQLTNSTRKLNELSNEVIALVQESLSLNELSYKFILNFIAKELIKQAEVEVIVSPLHSVPLAGLASNLLKTLPDLTYYLMARFYKKCPYLLGFTCPIDTEEGRIRMGWRRSNNKWEDESKYNERVGGIATLYAVITRIELQDSPVLIPMSRSWLFLSRMMNIKPELLQDVHYILVANWWEACCVHFLQTYRGQAQKLLGLICSQWLQVVENKGFSGYVRLRLLGEEWINEGKISSFKAMEY